jgi:hypothetical protein
MAYQTRKDTWSLTMTIDERLDRIEAMLVSLIERQKVKDYYEVEEFARVVGKAPFTVREWARLGRINGQKRCSGRGAHTAWVFSHAELLRYQRDGLLPYQQLAKDKHLAHRDA